MKTEQLVKGLQREMSTASEREKGSEGAGGEDLEATQKQFQSQSDPYLWVTGERNEESSGMTPGSLALVEDEGWERSPRRESRQGDSNELGGGPDGTISQISTGNVWPYPLQGNKAQGPRAGQK